MNIVSATTAKTNFGQIIDSAQSEVVLVEKSGRPYVYILSKKEYEALKALEDQHWLKEAEAGRETGYLSYEESDNLFSKLIRNKSRKVKPKGKLDVKTKNIKKNRKVLRKKAD